MTRWSPMTASGGPSAITLPWAITMTQSEMSRTMSMSCSTNSTVMPSSRRSLTWPSSDWVSAGFTPAIGSSSITISGLDHQRPGHLEQLALAAGQAAGEVLALGVELEAGQQVVGPLGDLAAPARPRAAGTARAKTFSPCCRWHRGACSRSPSAWTAPWSAGRCAPCPAGPPCAPARPCSDRPPNDQSPSSGWSKPVSRLKKVVLPAPLGPISAVIAPRWISTWSTSTAVRPPNCRTMPSATRIGSGFGAPGSWATSAQRGAAASRWPRRVPAWCDARSRVVVSGHRARSPSGRRRSPAAGRSSGA